MSDNFVDKITLGGSMGSERRQHIRFEPTRLVYAQIGEANGGIVINASIGGLCYQAVAPTQIASLIPLRIAPSGTESIGVSGRVVWTDESGKLGGMVFVNPAPEIRARIKHWLASQSISFDQESGRVVESENKEAAQAETAKAEIAEDPAETDQVLESKPEAPVFELPKSYKSSSSVPRMFGALNASAESPKFTYDEEPERPHHRILGAAAAGVIAAAIVLFPASYIYNFHPRLAASIVDRTKQLFGMSSSTPEAEHQQNASPSPEPQNSAPQAENFPKTTPQSTASTAIPPENNSSKPAAAAAQELEPTDAPRSTPTAIPGQPTTSPSSTETVQPPPAEAKQATTLRPAASVAKSTASKLEPAKTIVAPGSAVDPNDPNALWLAVGQGDTAAEVALARLYMMGHNVEKSCDQARVLLTAASKKGNAEAIQELRQFLRSGCK